MGIHRNNIKEIRKNFKTPMRSPVKNRKGKKVNVVNNGSVYKCNDTGKKYTSCKKVADVVDSSGYSEEGFDFWNVWLFFLLIFIILIIFIPY